VPEVPKAHGLAASACWALFNLWYISGAVPHPNNLDQIKLVFNSVDYSIWGNDHFMEILLVELRNNSPHSRMFLKRLNPRNDSVSEVLRPLRAVLRNILYKAP